MTQTTRSLTCISSFLTTVLLATMCLAAGDDSAAVPSAPYRLPTKELVQRLQPVHQAQGKLSSAEEKQLRADLLVFARKSPQDPWPKYVQGLLAWESREFSAAQRKFHSAIAVDSGCLAAWEQLLISQLRRTQDEQFLESLNRLADLTGQSQSAWPTSTRNAAARLLGRMCRFLMLPDGVWSNEPQADQRLKQIRFRIGTERQQAFSEGWKYTGLQHQQRSQLVQKQILTAQAFARKLAAKEKVAADKKSAEIANEAETVKLTAAQWKSDLDKRFKKSDQELARLQREYQLTLAARQVNLNHRVQAETDIGRMQTILLSTPTLQGRRVTNINNQPALLIRQQELQSLIGQSLLIEQKLVQIKQQAQQISVLRQRWLEQYRAATGDLARQDKTLKRYNQLVQASAKRADEKVENKSRVARLTRTLTSIDSYFPGDFSLQIEAVLNAAAPQTKQQNQQPPKQKNNAGFSSIAKPVLAKPPGQTDE